MPVGQHCQLHTATSSFPPHKSKLQMPATASLCRFVLGYILERKSQDDLRSSTQDGRLTHQKYRITLSRVANKLYLIEGHVKDLGASFKGGFCCGRNKAGYGVAATRVASSLMEQGVQFCEKAYLMSVGWRLFSPPLD